MNQLFNTSDMTLLKGTILFEKKPGYPVQSLGNADFNPADPLTVDKTYHKYTPPFSQNATTVASADQKTVHVAKASGVVSGFQVGNVTKAIGDSTATFDLLKNGGTVLNAPVVLNNASANYTPQVGAITAPGTYVAGDVFEVKITISAGTGTLPKGVYAQPTFDEQPG